MVFNPDQKPRAIDLDKLRNVCKDLQGPYEQTNVLKVLRDSANKCGVYVIMPSDLAWMYVGSTSSLSRRFSEHFSTLHYQKHPVHEIQRDYTDGIQLMYSYQICTDREKAYELEQSVMDVFSEDPGLLNVAVDAKAPWVRGKDYVHPLNGIKRDQHFKEKISTTAKKQYAEGRIAGFKGRSHTAETKQLFSERAKNRTFSEETKRKLSSQRQLGDHARAKPVIINKVEYDCVSSAAIQLGINYTTVYKRIRSKSSEFSEWYFKTV